MAFSDAQGFLSEDILRSMLMEQMRNDRLQQAGQAAATSIQQGIQGGLQLHQANQRDAEGKRRFDVESERLAAQAAEDRRRWDARDARAGSKHEADLAALEADLNAAKFKNETDRRLEGERRAKGSVPGMGARAAEREKSYDAEADALWGGVSEYEGDPERPDFNMREAEAMAEEFGVPVSTILAMQAEEKYRQDRRGADDAYTDKKRSGELAGIEADIEGKKARAAIDKRTARTGQLPTQHSRKDVYDRRPDDWRKYQRQPDIRLGRSDGGGGDGGGDGGGYDSSDRVRLLETKRKRAENAMVKRRAVEKALLKAADPDAKARLELEYKQLQTAIDDYNRMNEMMNKGLYGTGQPQAAASPSPSPSPATQVSTAQEARAVLEDLVGPEQVKSIVNGLHQSGVRGPELEQRMVYLAQNPHLITG